METYGWDDSISKPEDFMDKAWEKLEKNDVFDDRQRCGRPYLVDDSIATEVASLLKESHVLKGKKV